MTTPVGAYEVFFGPTNRLVTLKLIRYTIFMFTFPIFVFYFFRLIVFKEDKDKLGWCGIAAVVAANIVIVSYVWMAWNEDRDVSRQKLQPQQQQQQQHQQSQGKLRSD